MTDVVEGAVVADGEWTAEEAANHVRESWQDAVGSIIETGRRVTQAKERVRHGKWIDAVSMMPFGESTARKLMVIWSHPDLSNQEHVTDLPAAWGTLAVLAQLPPGEIPKRINAGEITPEIDRATAQSCVSTYAAAQQEALNAWSEAVDGLTRALSFAKTYTPPADLPENYVSVAEFVDRATNLVNIAEEWSQE